MKDEVLLKVLDSDDNIIPRFDIVQPDGTVLAENVQLVLKNTILTPGTPLNKQNLLSDDTSRELGLDPATSTPDTAFMSIRSSIGFCPRVSISYHVGGTISVLNENTQETNQYVVPEKGYVLIDILEYGAYQFWGEIYNTITPKVSLAVDTVKLYTVELDYFNHTRKFTVVEEVGATITATHSEGFTITGVIGPDKYCILQLPKPGTYTIVGVYDGCNSKTITSDITENMDGTTTVAVVSWAKVIVKPLDDLGNGITGVQIEVTESTLGFTRSGTSVKGQAKMWLPGYGTYNITGVWGEQHETSTLTVDAYKTYDVTLYFL